MGKRIILALDAVAVPAIEILEKNCSCTIHRAWDKSLINQATTVILRKLSKPQVFSEISITPFTSGNSGRGAE